MDNIYVLWVRSGDKHDFRDEIAAYIKCKFVTNSDLNSIIKSNTTSICYEWL